MENAVMYVRNRWTNDTFEEKAMSITLLIAVVGTALGLIFNVLLGASYYLDAFFLLCWVMTFLFKERYPWVNVFAFGLLVFGFFPYHWRTTEGSLGSLPYYSTLYMAVICIVFRGKQRLFFVASLLCTQLFLVRMDYRQWQVTGSSTVSISGFDFGSAAIHLTWLVSSIAALIILYANAYAAEKKRSTAYARALESQYHQQLKYMEHLEELNTRLRSDRHDFNNHIGVIYGLAEIGDMDRILTYASQLADRAESYRSFVRVPYVTVRALLNHKLSTAKEMGIELRLDVQLPSDLNLDEYDLCVILGNLLDNATEALKKLPEEKSYLSLKISFEPDYLIIRIENPYTGKSKLKDGRYISTKEDGENHGYGLGNVQRIVDRHHGMMKVEDGGQIFRVDVALLVDGLNSGL